MAHPNWQKHIAKRPEIEPYHDQIPIVVAQPHVVVETEDSECHYYRLGVGDGRYQPLYLRVIAGIGDGGIRTAFFCRSVDTKKGELVHVSKR